MKYYYNLNINCVYVYVYIYLFQMYFIPVIVKLNFQQPFLQAVVSHDSSETLQYADLVLKKHVLLLL